ncbi:MAG: AraC family transcriptional regulator [Cyanobacteria bacterium P01_G01_bin.19]
MRSEARDASASPVVLRRSGLTPCPQAYRLCYFMTIIFTEAQYDEQFEADKQKGIAKRVLLKNDCEQIEYYYDAYRSNECDRTIQLRHGLQMRVWSFESRQDLTIFHDNKNENHEFLYLSFFARGDIHTRLHGVTEKVNEAVGDSYLMYCPGADETESWKANQKILRVKVQIDPAKFFQGMSLEQFDSLPKQLQQFATKDEIAPFYIQNAIASEVYPILQQVLNCPDRGTMRQWYLEAKAVELMTLQLSHIQSANNSATQDRMPDTDSIYQAQAILQQNYLDPPSIIELAQFVGLSRVKLQQGFRRVFNTTPSGYLQNHRLDLARILLQDEKLTVTTVAHRIGYSNVSYFSRVFRHRFGVTPGQCRLGKKI